MSDLPETAHHIMVVEDDESLARWIADYLETEQESPQVIKHFLHEYLQNYLQYYYESHCI